MAPPPQCSGLYIGDLVCIVIFSFGVNTVSLSRTWACHTTWRGHNKFSDSPNLERPPIDAIAQYPPVRTVFIFFL